MTYGLPAPLVPGDLLYAVAPSGTLRETEKFEAGLQVWRDRGYQIELSPNYNQRWGYLAGKDHQRRQQLLAALKNPNYKGILCVRGGYGGTRLLENWQWPTDTQGHPINKWLIGFSDITSLLWSGALSGGVHGPLLTTISQEPDWSLNRLFTWLANHTLAPLTGESWVTGTATGKLLPANLTVATCLLGTAHEPDLAGAILAFEDVTEAPYRLDRMLTHWRMLGKFDQIAGIALGRFSQCEPPKNVPSFSALEVLQERLGDLGVPMVAALPFGHDGENAALPFGIPAKLEAHADGTGLLSFPGYGPKKA
ncbi:S66 peptidase family protein [Leptothoe kymatousa]|uniref:LD-carboxypeptidase n=1 Tax=Leptothoe kymatousa TAU-MAC 1615 TaxID=2364775 RepID=A0ABS5Y2U8_9CYAN|nr:LD-carboxypeptidase [Leptothoe kymatousa]MBT9311833.1 LD-carboxypeptidase [Leptothoe kymatousa TAU-MAC 1615]